MAMKPILLSRKLSNDLAAYTILIIMYGVNAIMGCDKILAIDDNKVSKLDCP